MLKRVCCTANCFSDSAPAEWKETGSECPNREQPRPKYTDHMRSA